MNQTASLRQRCHPDAVAPSFFVNLTEPLYKLSIKRDLKALDLTLHNRQVLVVHTEHTHPLMSTKQAAATALRLRRRRALAQLSGGVTVLTIPVGIWWYWSIQQRKSVTEAYETQVRIPKALGSQDTYDFLISEKCQAGDVILFDRRPERCAAGPWAALACLLGRQLLTSNGDNNLSAGSRRYADGRFDHAGIIVPGYIRNKADAYDPTNLLLLEATPSGIVARPLKERLERSASRSILLLPLACPGERRNEDEPETIPPIVERTRGHVERQLRQFRDRWIELGQEHSNRYQWVHSTIAIGGAMCFGLNLQDYSSGPVSPSAYLVLLGLFQGAAAQNINDKENRRLRVEDFLRDPKQSDTDVVRLRPGWRFLPPIALKETSRM